MLENGHSREAVLGYELPYIYGFVMKKLDQNKEAAERLEKSKNKDGWQQRGNKRTKTMTSDQMLRKARGR